MRARIALALLLLLPLAGCASAWSCLSDEDAVPELASLKERWQARGNHTRLIETRRADEPPVRIAVHQIKSPGTDRVFVMLHGVMADHRAYRFMVGSLVEDGSAWLIDLPGCGESDKPRPSDLGPDGYSPAAMADRILDAIGQCLAEEEGPPPRITLVGHSLGGAVVIRMLADPALHARHAEVLARVDGTVLFSPLDIAVHRPDPFFRELATISGTRVRTASALGLLEDRITAGTLNSVSDRRYALREEARTRAAYLTDPARRRALQAMLQQAVPWRPGYRPDWESMESVVRMYANIDRPCLIIWGERDEVLPCAMGYKLAAQIPGARLICLPGIKHSPEIECPGVAAQLVRQFASGDHAPEAVGGHSTAAR